MFDHFECVKVELTDGIAWVRMNRPEKRNAMNPQLHDEMEEALTARIGEDLAELGDSLMANGTTGTSGADAK